MFRKSPCHTTHPEKKHIAPQPSNSTRQIVKALPVWERELEGDEDRDFIINGIKYGFKLVDGPTTRIEKLRSDNHSSAIKYADKVEKRIKEEIADGNYVITEDKEVTLVSPLAAIEKQNGDIRILHDLSFPENRGLNSFAEKEVCKYENFEDIIKTLKPGTFMAKCDLQWAYRSVPVCEEHQTLTGLKWKFKGEKHSTTLVDTALGMGARKSPAHFNRLTQAIKRCMVRKGFNCHAYLDDFLVHHVSFDECARALTTLIALLRSLGLRIAWTKVTDPCQHLVFLGIAIDTTANTLSLDPAKLTKTMDKIDVITSKTRVTRKVIESLCGSLIWCTNVIPFAKAYMNSLFQTLRSLKSSNHKARLTAPLLEELKWWKNTLAATTHRRAIWVNPRDALLCLTDACNIGGGVFVPSKRHWHYTNFVLDKPDLANAHINVKELVMVQEAINILGPNSQGQQIHVLTDNTTTMNWINNWTARPHAAATILKNIAASAIKWNITINCLHIRGCHNTIADSISRLHQPGQLYHLCSLLRTFYNYCHPTYFLPDHMSPLSALFLCPQVLCLQQKWASWIKKSLPYASTHLPHLQRTIIGPN